MNKKYLILTSLACLAVTGVTATAIASMKGGYNTLGVKAEPKSYVFNSYNTQFDDTTTPSVVERDVITGVSDPLSTSVSLTENGSAEVTKFFSSDGYFVRNGASTQNPTFTVTIGVNNATSLRVLYGVSDDRPNAISCTFHLKNSLGVDLFTPSQTLEKGVDKMTQGDLSWTLSTDGEIKEVEIVVTCDRAAHSSAPIFIKSITLGWSC